jgi:hypothetical protein
MPSTKDEKGNIQRNIDPLLTPEFTAVIASEFRAKAKAARITAKAKQKTAVAKHKAAVKGRRKAKSTPAPVVPSTPTKG